MCKKDLKNYWNGSIGEKELKILEKIYDQVYAFKEKQEDK